MENFRLYIVNMLMLMILASSSKSQITVYSGLEGGSYNQMALDMANVCTGLKIEKSKGSVDNFRKLMTKDGPLIAFLQEDVIIDEQYKDLQEGTFRLDGLRVILPLGLEEIHLVVKADSKLKGLKDLRGKRVNIGSDGQGTTITAKMIKEITKSQWRDHTLPWDSVIPALLARKIDAFIFVGATPVIKFTDEYKDQLKILPLDDDRLGEFYHKTIIAAGAYPFVTSDVVTYGVKSLLVTNLDKLDAKNISQLDNFVDELYKGSQTQLTNGHSKWKSVEYDLSSIDWIPYAYAFDLFHPTPKAGSDLNLLSGITGGSYETFAHDIEKISGAVKSVTTSKGSVDNFRQLYRRESIYLCFMQQDVLAQQRMEDIAYETEYTKNMRVILPLAFEEIHLITRKSDKITDVKMLKKKRIAIGSIFQGTHLTSKLIRDIVKGEWIEIPMPIDSVIIAMQKKQIDGFFFVGSSPVSKFLELPENSDLQIVSLNNPKLEKVYTPIIIKAGTYPWQNTDVNTFAVTSVLVTNIQDETPEQRAQIEKLLNDIKSNISTLQATGHPKWKEVTFDFKNVKWEIYDVSKSIFN